jgi:hypothetical protein
MIDIIITCAILIIITTIIITTIIMAPFVVIIPTITITITITIITHRLLEEHADDSLIYYIVSMIKDSGTNI